jgi:hypothetical protein
MTRSSPNHRRIRSLPQAVPLSALAVMLVPQPFGLGFSRHRQKISSSVRGICSDCRSMQPSSTARAPRPRGPRVMDGVFGDLQCCGESRWRRQQFPEMLSQIFMAPFLVGVIVSGSHFTPRLKCRPGRLSPFACHAVANCDRRTWSVGPIARIGSRSPKSRGTP